MLNKLIGERDWSAQELSHILLRHPVQQSSHTLASLDCRPEDAQRDLPVLESGDVTAQRSTLRRYRDRLPIPLTATRCSLSCPCSTACATGTG